MFFISCSRSVFYIPNPSLKGNSSFADIFTGWFFTQILNIGFVLSVSFHRMGPLFCIFAWLVVPWFFHLLVLWSFFWEVSWFNEAWFCLASKSRDQCWLKMLDLFSKDCVQSVRQIANFYFVCRVFVRYLRLSIHLRNFASSAAGFPLPASLFRRYWTYSWAFFFICSVGS